ncbi:MAG: MFS transporter [Chloroflexi bacterium]|nr:MFS transporter [Chloroflexota bacterium]
MAESGDTGARTHASPLRSLILTVYGPAFLIALGQGAGLLMIPLLAIDLGASVALAGLVFALRGFGTIVFDVPAGLAESRFGDRRTLAAGAALIVIVGVGSALSGNVWQLAFFTFLYGGGNAVFQVARLSYIAEVTPVEYRARAIALLGGANRVGTFAGPILGGVLAQALGFPSVFLFQAATAALALVLVLLLIRGGAAATASGHSVYARLGRTLVDHRRSFLTWGLAVITLQVIRSGRQILLPLWGAHIELDVAAIGVVVGLSSGIDMLLFYPVGVMMDRWGRKGVALSSLLMLSIGLALIPLARGFEALLLVGVVTGFGNGLGTGIVMTLGADLSPPTGRGEFLGVWRLVGDVGHAGGPFVIGAVAQALTLAVAAAVTAGVGLVGAVFLALVAAETLRRAPPRPAEPARERSTAGE